MKIQAWIVILLLAISSIALPATKTQNQIYVLCKAALRYSADIESQTGYGPKWKALMKAMRAYDARIDYQYVNAWEAVLGQMRSGQVPIADTMGTATNCLRWYQDDELGDL